MFFLFQLVADGPCVVRFRNELPDNCFMATAAEFVTAPCPRAMAVSPQPAEPKFRFHVPMFLVQMLNAMETEWAVVGGAVRDGFRVNAEAPRDVDIFVSMPLGGNRVWKEFHGNLRNFGTLSRVEGSGALNYRRVVFTPENSDHSHTFDIFAEYRTVEQQIRSHNYRCNALAWQLNGTVLHGFPSSSTEAAYGLMFPVPDVVLRNDVAYRQKMSSRGWTFAPLPQKQPTPQPDFAEEAPAVVVEPMAAVEPLPAPVPETAKREYPHITVSKGIGGWFAVEVVWNTDHGGFSEPYDTGIGRYEMQSDAIAEGEAWAKMAGCQFYAPEIDTAPARQDVTQQLLEIIPDLQVIELSDFTGEKEGGTCHTCEGDGLSCENEDKCLNSERDCGHHCNHVLSHDECCWCNSTGEKE